MKKMSRTAAAVFALAAASTFSSAALAQNNQLSFKPSEGMEISIGRYTETYKESNDDGSPLMQEEADMTSIKFMQTTGINDAWSQRFSMEYAFGDSTYTGSYWGGQYGDLVEGGISRWRLQTDYQLLLTPQELKGLTFTGGLGYRILRDNLQETAGGYERTNRLLYATLGAEYRINLQNNWTLTPAVQYKHLISGTQMSPLSEDLKQSKGSGHDLSLRLEKTNSYGYGFSATAYLRTWDIKASDMAPYVGGGYVYEPANKTREVGIQLGYVF